MKTDDTEQLIEAPAGKMLVDELGDKLKHQSRLEARMEDFFILSGMIFWVIVLTLGAARMVIHLGRATFWAFS